jgi:alkylation response protein AidB-like acyl-CoA dehydrogenase
MIASPWRFRPVVLTAREVALRQEVRAFLSRELGAHRTAGALEGDSYRPGLGMSAGYSPEFSRKLAARGWVGMAVPREYGGHDRTAVERYLVIEELLAAGAPVAAHWVADRQTAPTLLAFGTEEQRRKLLPAICRGECYFSIGMSERQSGSDLASVRTVADRVEGGWRLRGHKIWTGGAHVNHYFVVLCRTSPLGEDRHQGLSQVIVDLRSPGVRVRPIRLLNGVHVFNEVLFEDVFVPDDMLLGEPGDGWRQVTSELAYERSGPDRFLSTYQLLETYLRERPQDAGREATRETLGGLCARLATIRQLSLAVARSLDEAMAPAVEAALVKDLGTTFEQEVVAALQELVEDEPDPTSPSLFESLLAESVLMAPSYTIRGGTTEVLRTVAARGLSRHRDVPPSPPRPGEGGGNGEPADSVVAAAERVLAERWGEEQAGAADDAGWSPELWEGLAAAGLPWRSVPERSGGAGGTVREACALLRVLGQHAAPVPVAEAGLLGGWLLAEAGLPLPAKPIAVGGWHLRDQVRLLPAPGGGWELECRLHRVPWARAAAAVAVLAPPVEGAPTAWRVALVPADRLSIEEGRNLADEPRDAVFGRARLGSEAVGPLPPGVDAEALWGRGALTRAILMAGAMERVAEQTIAYANRREQFGRRIASFQAVQQHLVRLSAETALAAMAVDVATEALASGDARFETAVAKAVTSRAAGLVAGLAHQVHGAIGMTRECGLHRFTRRLWSWRQEYGSARWWNRWLGAEVARCGPAELWPRLARGLAAPGAEAAPSTTQ